MLTFSPLYFVFHDCWQFDETLIVRDAQGMPRNQTVTYDHAGHVHFFMMDYNTLKNASQQAYSGSQQYNFTVEDVWGPNSTDPNQTKSYKLIGKPRWYFHIEEYWRRVYIQPWDVEDYAEKHVNHPERIGLKYDASKPEHSFGPFREGGGFHFFDTEVNRTLPVEYWLDEEKTQRQHLLRKQHYQWDETRGGEIWNFEKPQRVWERHDRYDFYSYHYWQGDNAYYDHEYQDYYYDCRYLGYNKPGNIVCDNKSDKRKFYRYKMIPSTPVTQRGENYWPNPRPGSAPEDLWDDYLDYFDFYPDYYNPRKYSREYAKWLDDNGKDKDQESFEAFISIKAEEFQRNCLSDDLQTLLFEYIGFEDYCNLWEELTREEIIALGLYGDYPLLREDMELPEHKTHFGPDDDPFHKEGKEVNPWDVYKTYFENREEYTIPRGRKADGDMPIEGGHPRETSYSDEDGARRFYSDNLYVTPVIEYQKVVHLDYERLPEAKAAEADIDIWTDVSGNFGDGFSVTVNIPFRINGVVQSPFSDDNGVVYPPGDYFHGMKEERKLHYDLESYGKELSGETDEKEINAAMEKVRKYRFSAYQKFMSNDPSPEDRIAWFNQEYANRPITMNEEEGHFDTAGNWIEVVTHDRPRIDQVTLDAQGKPTMNPKVVKFHNPGYREDGLWVEQCLGARVIPKVEFVFEDALGHRFTRWVDAMEAASDQPFIGKS